MITALVDDSLARDDINALKESMHLLGRHGKMTKSASLSGEVLVVRDGKGRE